MASEQIVACMAAGRVRYNPEDLQARAMGEEHRFFHRPHGGALKEVDPEAGHGGIMPRAGLQGAGGWGRLTRQGFRAYPVHK